MEKLRFTAHSGMVVNLRSARRDLAVKGGAVDHVEITLDGKPEQCSVEELDDTLIIDSQAALSVSVPQGAAVTIGEAFGDVLIRNLEGEVSIDTARGDLSVKSAASSVAVGQVDGDAAFEGLLGTLAVQVASADVRLVNVRACTLGAVHGGLRARDVGQLQAGLVSGDARITNVSGDLVLETVMGDLKARDLGGAMDVKQVRGDISLKTSLVAGTTYSGRASGSINAKFPEDASARFELSASGEIRAKLPDRRAGKGPSCGPVWRRPGHRHSTRRRRSHSQGTWRSGGRGTGPRTGLGLADRGPNRNAPRRDRRL